MIIKINNLEKIKLFTQSADLTVREIWVFICYFITLPAGVTHSQYTACGVLKLTSQAGVVIVLTSQQALSPVLWRGWEGGGPQQKGSFQTLCDIFAR